MDKEIIEGNRLITKFDIGIEDLPIEYHNSFHLMMPVCDKINKISKETGYIDDLDIFNLRVISVTEKELFDSIVQYVKWYNTQTKNS